MKRPLKCLRAAPLAAVWTTRKALCFCLATSLLPDPCALRPRRLTTLSIDLQRNWLCRPRIVRLNESGAYLAGIN